MKSENDRLHPCCGRTRRGKFFCMMLVLFLITGAASCAGRPSHSAGTESGRPEKDAEPGSHAGREGQIFLYGEAHSQEAVLKKELELWGQYYEKGMRDLFIEYPYFTAEFLNLWMRSEDDGILDAVYADWEGSFGHSPLVREFYLNLKEKYPETIFHGTDVGHGYDRTGQRYLEYLEKNGKKDSRQYAVAQENIEQGKHFYEQEDFTYRENMMAQNFIREYDSLGSSAVMGIYGGAHTDLDGMESQEGAVPCMANQLKEHYGESVCSEDVASFVEPLRTETISMGGREYQAAYYGKSDYSGRRDQEFTCIQYWWSEEAYDDFSSAERTETMISSDEFPGKLEERGIVAADFTRRDGSVERYYFRYNGRLGSGEAGAVLWGIEVEE